MNPNRSAPVETLHTILLGPYKYFLKDLMAKLNTDRKEKFKALISAFDYSGFDCRIVGNICYHYRSFVGRDYKALAQMAPFIVTHFVTKDEMRIWLCLSKASSLSVILL